MEQKPSIGRIVLVVIRDRHNGLVPRPAIIVRTWGDPSNPGKYINCRLFLDGTNDMEFGIELISWLTSVPYDPEGKAANTWHWPPRA